MSLDYGKEVNAVMLVGRLFHTCATVTRNDRSPMVLSLVRGTYAGAPSEYLGQVPISKSSGSRSQEQKTLYTSVTIDAHSRVD